MKSQKEVIDEITKLSSYLIATVGRIKSGHQKRGDKGLTKTLRNDIKTLKWVLGVEKHIH